MKHITLRTHEVQNILAGRQTRLSRPVKPQPEAIRGHHVAGYSTDLDVPWPADYGFGVLFSSAQFGLTEAAKCPFGKVGDIIACKEGWCYYVDENGYTKWDQFLYRADGEDIRCLDADGFDAYNKDGTASSPWISPVTMPLSACRLFLRIKEIRVERIQDITEEGAKAEGVNPAHYEGDSIYTRDEYTANDKLIYNPTYRAGFEALHQSIYGPDSWDLNLWHWIVIFEKTDKPE